MKNVIHLCTMFIQAIKKNKAGHKKNQRLWLLSFPVAARTITIATIIAITTPMRMLTMIQVNFREHLCRERERERERERSKHAQCKNLRHYILRPGGTWHYNLPCKQQLFLAAYFLTPLSLQPSPHSTLCCLKNTKAQQARHLRV